MASLDRSEMKSHSGCFAGELYVGKCTYAEFDRLRLGNKRAVLDKDGAYDVFVSEAEFRQNAFSVEGRPNQADFDL